MREPKKREKRKQKRRKNMRFPWRQFERRYALLVLNDLENEREMHEEAMRLEKKRKVEYVT